MKKLFLSILMIVVLAAIPAHSATYTLSTGVPADSGNTTVANGGVSVFALNNTSGSYDLYPQIDRTYAYGFQLTSILPSQAASVGDWSGTTFSVFAKFKSESDDVPWNDVEPHYLYKDEAVSGNTPEMRWLNVPPADRARIYFVSEGGTAFGLGAAKLIASEIPLQVVEPVIKISSQDVVVHSSHAGTSTWTVPPGTRFGIISVAAASAGGLAATFDGTTVSLSTAGSGVDAGKEKVYPVEMLRVMKFKGTVASGCTTTCTFLTGHPDGN